VPTLESLRFLNPTQLRARVAGMLERLGYELLTPETVADMQATKDGRKYVVAFAAPQIRCRRRPTVSRDCTVDCQGNAAQPRIVDNYELKNIGVKRPRSVLQIIEPSRRGTHDQRRAEH
jgi:hypothetical protein